MTIEALIDLAENKLRVLREARNHALTQGDTTTLASFDSEIAQTQGTLARLRSV